MNIILAKGGAKESQRFVNQFFVLASSNTQIKIIILPCTRAHVGLCVQVEKKKNSNREHLHSDYLKYLLCIFQILTEREELQQDIDKLMSWIKDTEKQLKAPLKLRFKSKDVEKQLEKMKELQADVIEHERPVNKAVADAEAVMKQSKSPMKTELKNKMDGKHSTQ